MHIACGRRSWREFGSQKDVGAKKFETLGFPLSRLSEGILMSTMFKSEWRLPPKFRFAVANVVGTFQIEKSHIKSRQSILKHWLEKSESLEIKIELIHLRIPLWWSTPRGVIPSRVSRVFFFTTHFLLRKKRFASFSTCLTHQIRMLGTRNFLSVILCTSSPSVWYYLIELISMGGKTNS